MKLEVDFFFIYCYNENHFRGGMRFTPYRYDKSKRYSRGDMMNDFKHFFGRDGQQEYQKPSALSQPTRSFITSKRKGNEPIKMNKKDRDKDTQREKPKKNKSRAVANSVVQKKSKAKDSFGIVDNRPTIQRMKRILINGVITTVPDEYVPPPSPGRRLDGSVGEPTASLEDNIERNKEMRRLAYEAALHRQQKARERGVPRVKHEREAHESLENQFILLGSGQDIYNRLGPLEKWREHIDGRHQHHGREVYTKALHGKKPDPDYNKNMFEADRSIGATFGRRFNMKDFHDAHRATFSDPTEFGANFRQKPLDVHFRAFKSPLTRLQAEHDDDPLINSFRTPSEGDPNHTVRLAAPAKHPMEIVRDILDKHYENIRTAENSEDKLKVIAKTHKDLENLHPYVDHNSRVNRLVLNRLLAEQGMAPTILENPLDVHHSDIETWVGSIKSGQDKWLSHARRLGDQSGQWQKLDKMTRLSKSFNPSISHEEVMNEFMRN